MTRQEKLMPNKSGTVISTGIISLIFILVAIAWELLARFTVGWISSVPQQAASDLRSIAANPGLYLGFLSVDVLYNLGIFALGALFYLIFRSFNRSLALFGALGFITTGLIWLILDMQGFAQYQLALDLSTAGASAASGIVQRAADLSLWSAYSRIITDSLMAIGLLSFGALIIRSRAVLRLLGWVVVVAGLFMLAALGFSFTDQSLIWSIAYYIVEFWILVMGLWLLMSGVKENKEF
jgi:hypothetical protein